VLLGFVLLGLLVLLGFELLGLLVLLEPLVLAPPLSFAEQVFEIISTLETWSSFSPLLLDAFTSDCGIPP
jgi:hypothetical protein